MSLMVLVVLLVAVVIAIFAGQNATPVDVRFLTFGPLQTSLATVIIGSMAGGAILMALINVAGQLRGKMKIWDYQSQVKRLESEIEDLKKKNEEQAKEIELLTLRREKEEKKEETPEKMSSEEVGA